MHQNILDYEICLPESEKFTENLDDYYIFSAPDPHKVMTKFCTILLSWNERIFKYFKWHESKYKRELTPEEKEALAKRIANESKPPNFWKSFGNYVKKNNITHLPIN